MSKNDDRIIELKNQIEIKKKELADKRIKFTPETNCVLELEGTNYNLNVCAEEILTLLMIKLNTYIMSANDLGVSVPTMSGYPIDLWISDIKNKLVVTTIKREETNLKQMEAKLDKLLSDDKKTELELDETASLLS